MTLTRMRFFGQAGGMQTWVPIVMGVVGGTAVGVAWLAAVVTLVHQRRKSRQEAVAELDSASAPLEPIRSLLEPDDGEPSSPLPSMSMAPLSLSRYIEVRGAIAGWSSSGESVDEQLDAVFGLTRAQYREAHGWWMSALEGAEDRLDDLERQVAVFASRYGGSV